MALLDNILNIGANAQAAAITHIALHTAAPDSNGSNQAASARLPITWGAASGGDLTATNVPRNFTGGAASGPATHVGFWSAVSGGTFYGAQALTGDQTFNAAGEYSITALTINGSST